MIALERFKHPPGPSSRIVQEIIQRSGRVPEPAEKIDFRTIRRRICEFSFRVGPQGGDQLLVLAIIKRAHTDSPAIDVEQLRLVVRDVADPHIVDEPGIDPSYCEKEIEAERYCQDSRRSVGDINGILGRATFPPPRYSADEAMLE